jgi:hypothetical protein
MISRAQLLAALDPEDRAELKRLECRLAYLKGILQGDLIPRHLIAKATGLSGRGVADVEEVALVKFHAGLIAAGIDSEDLDRGSL